MGPGSPHVPVVHVAVVCAFLAGWDSCPAVVYSALQMPHDRKGGLKAEEERAVSLEIGLHF